MDYTRWSKVVNKPGDDVRGLVMMRFSMHADVCVKAIYSRHMSVI